MSQFEIDPDTAVLVGDTIHDAEVAQHMGVNCVLLTTGHQAPERLNQLRLPVLSSLDAVESAL